MHQITNCTIWRYQFPSSALLQSACHCSQTYVRTFLPVTMMKVLDGPLINTPSQNETAVQPDNTHGAVSTFRLKYSEYGVLRTTFFMFLRRPGLAHYM